MQLAYSFVLYFIIISFTFRFLFLCFYRCTVNKQHVVNIFVSFRFINWVLVKFICFFFVRFVIIFVLPLIWWNKDFHEYFRYRQIETSPLNRIDRRSTGAGRRSPNDY